MFSTVANPKPAATPYTIPSITSLKFDELYALALTARYFIVSSTSATERNAVIRIFPNPSSNSMIVAGIMPKPPRRKVIPISCIGSRLYLPLSTTYFSNSAAGATASNSKRSKSAIFYLSKLQKAAESVK